MAVIKANLNLINVHTPPVIFLKQYDRSVTDDGKVLEFNLYEGFLPYAVPEGAIVTIRGTKPDNSGYSYSCSYNGNVVRLNVQSQMTVLAGKHNAEIRISKQENIVGTASIVFDVEKTALPEDVIISKTDLPNLEKAVESYERVTEKAAEVDANAKKAAASATDAQTSANAASSSASASAVSAKKAEDAYKQAAAIAGVGEFAYYIGADKMLHMKFKEGGL